MTPFDSLTETVKTLRATELKDLALLVFTVQPELRHMDVEIKKLRQAIVGDKIFSGDNS